MYIGSNTNSVNIVLTADIIIKIWYTIMIKIYENININAIKISVLNLFVRRKAYGIWK